VTAAPAPTLSGTVADAFARTAARRPTGDWLQVLPETAQRFGIDARTWTYAEAAGEVSRLRALYADAGLRQGHRVGLLLLNRPEFLLHWLALNGLGVSIVPINPDWRAHELEYLVAHSEIVAAACLEDRIKDLDAAASAVGRQLSLTNPAGSDLPRVDAVLREPAERAAGRGERTDGDTQSECALLYTSGTTGRPKGCVLSNEYFLWGGQWYAQIGGLCDVRPDVERMLTPLPLTHMNALACSAMCTMMTGSCLILLDRFHPRSWWSNVRESRATIAHYLGVMPAMLLAAPASPDDRRHDVRFGFGAGVNPRHHAEFEQRFGFPLLEAWAMTETGVGGVVIANREPRFVGTACFGAAADDVECRVVDDEGHDVAADTPGELLVRHAGAAPRFGFFREDLKDPEATAAAWEGGWFHTGDLVRRDELGYFRFVDRKKNVIRRSGENISAVEVESVLAQHPAVRAVGVTAVPDDVRGDEVFACVVAAVDDIALEVLAADLAEHCRKRLAYFKAPGYVAVVDALPLTPTEKIQRAALKELAATLLTRGECADVRGLKRRVDA
jgi:acyl-CoA synthetase (AMP-forming)/AMP-acid ligase II